MQFYFQVKEISVLYLLKTKNKLVYLKLESIHKLKYKLIKTL